MNKIRILPEKVATRIAAGEVIERPASVVRELLDNSIDAGADRIIVKIEKGGKGLIRVSDNGAGMGRDDLLLCLERHATSKVHSVSDLFSINTLGFRGEALPSISSVSRMVITSRPADQLSGHRLKIEGGNLKSIEETGSPEGTIVEVRDLFFNIPARKKFLRAIKTETRHVVDTLSRIALPFTNIHFRLDDNGRTVLNIPASENEVNRLTIMMGKDVAGSMTEARHEADELAIAAYLGPPDLSRSRGDRIFIYVNGRNVRDRLITRAIMEGYGQRLMKGRYPQTVIFLDIDPSLVDINVHPTKQEVRFHNGHAVYTLIVSIIEDALGKQFHNIYEPAYTMPVHDEKGKRYAAGLSVEQPEWEYTGPEQDRSSRAIGELREEYRIKEKPRIIGQFNDTYILCQFRDGLIMIDQHAAHERIVYETLKKSYNDAHLESQSFLIPHRLELSLKEGRIVLKNLGQLARLGLELEHFGGNTFLLRSIPSILVNVKWEEFLLDLIPVLEEGGDVASEKALDKILTVMSCHGAIRAGKRMSQEEMNSLLDQLEKMDLPTNCPHGRPVLKKFTFYEIERMFKRVV